MKFPSANNGETRGKFILLGHSPSWISAIENATAPEDLIFAVDLDDLYHEAQHSFGSIGLIELPDVETPGNFLRKIAQIADNPWQVRLIALVNRQTAPWLPLARIAGFSRILRSTIEVKSLSTFSENHFRSVDWPHLELETRIESQLPWPIRSPQPQTRNQI